MSGATRRCGHGDGATPQDDRLDAPPPSPSETDRLRWASPGRWHDGEEGSTPGWTRFVGHGQRTTGPRRRRRWQYGVATGHPVPARRPVERHDGHRRGGEGRGAAALPSLLGSSSPGSSPHEENPEGRPVRAGAAGLVSSHDRRRQPDQELRGWPGSSSCRWSVQSLQAVPAKATISSVPEALPRERYAGMTPGRRAREGGATGGRRACPFAPSSHAGSSVPARRGLRPRAVREDREREPPLPTARTPVGASRAASPPRRWSGRAPPVRCCVGLGHPARQGHRIGEHAHRADDDRSRPALDAWRIVGRSVTIALSSTSIMPRTPTSLPGRVRSLALIHSPLRHPLSLPDRAANSVGPPPRPPAASRSIRQLPRTAKGANGERRVMARRREAGGNLVTATKRLGWTQRRPSRSTSMSPRHAGSRRPASSEPASMAAELRR